MAKRDDDLEFSMNAAFDEARSVTDTVPLYLVNGSLGAGKTSLLEFLLRQTQFSGSRVIENEFANENVDGYRLERVAGLVATLAGDCVCCSSRDALPRLLFDFARESSAPVFIEATGVAQTMPLVARLVNSNIFEKYQLMHSFYVIDAQELLRGVEPQHQVELEAADTVLVTKADILNEADAARLQEVMAALPYQRVVLAPHGVFDLAGLVTPSGLLGFFDRYDGRLTVPDNPTYSVVDLSGCRVSEAAMAGLWPELAASYGLRRLKGCFVDVSGRPRHIEATEHSLEISAASADEPAKIVLIGQRADEISRDVLLGMMALFA